ncbi:MAG: aldehyde dehydrogenase family protein [Deltaproteobacteria bacterium]
MSAAPAQNLAGPHTDITIIPGIVADLRQYFRGGQTRPLSWRRAQLGRLRDLFTENKEALQEALAQDLGKPSVEAYISDIAVVVAEIDLVLKGLSQWTRPEKVATPLTQQPAKSTIRREPLGVVLIIAPWNYPVQLLLSPLVGAIAAGNCAVLKPSEITENTSALLGRLVAQYLDNQAIQVVEGAVAETTALLAERFDHLFYTGNGTVGRIVMEAAAKHLTPVTLELGGKSPVIIAADANLDIAAHRIAWGKFLNAGQTCVAPDYILVDASIEEKFTTKLKDVLKEFYGDDPHASKDFGRLASARHHQRLASMLEGQDVIVGGDGAEAERYLAPTLVRRPDPESRLMQEEIFGPILPILPVENLDEAIEFVNGREKPLALYIFTNNATVAERVLDETSSGGACVNASVWHVANPHLPFGGVGPSGMGSYHGRGSFETFSHRKAVVDKSTWVDPKIAYPPYTAFKKTLISKAM